MITCQKCGKENQDHYKFCLGCGAELPRDAAPKPFAPQTPPHGMKAVNPASAGASGASTAASAGSGAMRAPAPSSAGGAGSSPFYAAPSGAPAAAAPAPAAAAPAPVPSAAPAAAPAGASGAPASVSSAATVICPQCSHANTPANLFCSSCGFRLTQQQKAGTAVFGAAPAAGQQVVLTALRADGTEAGTYEVPNGGNATIGRDTGAIFSSDSYLSPRHATFRIAGGKLFLKDEGSLNGVYKKLSRDVPVEVRPNDVFRIGQEIVRYETFQPQPPSPDGVERLGAPYKGFVGRFALITGRDTTGNAFLVPEVGMHMGRERGEVLFPEDGYVSGLHCRISFDGPRMMLTDLGSSNGTFVRLREETEVKTGDVLLMGQQLFRVQT